MVTVIVCWGLYGGSLLLGNYHMHFTQEEQNLGQREARLTDRYYGKEE